MYPFDTSAMAVFSKQTLVCNADSDAVFIIADDVSSVVVVTPFVCSCSVVEGVWSGLSVVAVVKAWHKLV